MGRPLARKFSYNLDDDGEGEASNLCTQHAKIVMRRVTGRRVMAKDLERAVRRERVYTEMILQAFSGGWDAAMKSIESEEALY